MSPLLANIYLTALDRELERRGLAFCRYADDSTVFVNSERSADRSCYRVTVAGSNRSCYRVTVAGWSNRRMRKTAPPVVGEGWRAQSRQPDP